MNHHPSLPETLCFRTENLLNHLHLRPTRTVGRGNSVVLMGGNIAPHRHSAVAVMLMVIIIICITITTTYNFLTSHPPSPYHHNILTKVQYYPLHQTPSHTCRKRKALIGSTQGKRHVLSIFFTFFTAFNQSPLFWLSQCLDESSEPAPSYAALDQEKRLGWREEQSQLDATVSNPPPWAVAAVPVHPSINPCESLKETFLFSFLNNESTL